MRSLRQGRHLGYLQYSLESFRNHSTTTDGIKLDFFANGLGHMPPGAAARAEQLLEKSGFSFCEIFRIHMTRTLWCFGRAPNTIKTSSLSDSYLRYLAQDVAPILERSSASVRVHKVNRPPAPIQFRVLCCFQIRPASPSRIVQG